MGKKFANILETVGNTPVVRINKLAPPDVNLYVKVEAFNPLGSVKDRLALGVIEDAERKGKLKPGQTVVEATSGNTGIGLAMVCAAKGYPLVVTMAESFSIERRKLMRFLGAKVIITPASARAVGMVKKTEELAKKHGWFYTRQFENEANATMHSRTTAQGNSARLQGRAAGLLGYGIRHWRHAEGRSAGAGKEAAGDEDRGLRAGGRADACRAALRRRRKRDGSAKVAHPSWKPHPMQGWSPDFIGKLAGDAVNMKVISQVLTIANADALKCSKELAKKEGIFVGISSGATFAGALRVAAEAPKGSTILCMLPDTGERYLSTPLFADVSVDMTEEEVEIAHSTPGCWLPTPQ